MGAEGWSVGAGLEGRGVVVTGAAGGIGQAVTRAFATAGANVLAVDVDQGRVEDVLAGCDGDGHVALGIDLADLGAHQSIVETARRRLGGAYVLAHTAAVLRRRSRITEVTEDDWDLQLDVNLKATFFLARAVAEEMASAGRGGRIVLFSSQGWWTGGFGGSVVYAASKGGIVTMCRGLARTYGPAGITVNSVAPGQINTPMLLTDLDPAVYERMTKETPLGYVGEPEDIAGVVVFLSSTHARYISGATINVSGAFLMY
ncbi:MAG TPA: SDR family oxidoreductase [Acidimicrobiales bacterium]|nr:SDR family oxidoreductase [Acidimicrobiales bacterium]